MHIPVCENIHKIKKELPSGVTLVAVSKTKPRELIMALYNDGHRVFGENKVQELVEKYEALPKDIEWHMIGHLQRNKVKFLAPFVSLIHGVDSLKLLRTINAEGARIQRVIPCLLQVHIAAEETKFGLTANQLEELLRGGEFPLFNNIEVKGLMGMASYTDDDQQVRDEFRGLRQLFERVKQQFFSDDTGFDTLSMGMSGDFRLAVEEGSTMVRVGSAIFGERTYPA